MQNLKSTFLRYLYFFKITKTNTQIYEKKSQKNGFKNFYGLQ